MSISGNGAPSARWTKISTILNFALIVLVAFLIGRWTASSRAVKAAAGGTPQIQLQAIRGDSSLTVYYPDLNKLFVYQTPFVGLPNWGCAYSVQLSSPGGNIDREPCPNPGQQFQ
ncbi:MAG: hypothetical protein JO033_21370 [Acidobacteriaceae bacterium]|nr:hypothetical protein [Acidobacteriaceae bacterium]MBV9498571.1 hypothetical protein [Acidobacteriaceae bacterium]